MRINWWTVAQLSVVLLVIGLASSVKAEVEPETHFESFHLTWNQLVVIVGGVGALGGVAAEFRRWMMDLDRRVARIEEHCDKEDEE